MMVVEENELECEDMQQEDEEVAEVEVPGDEDVEETEEYIEEVEATDEHENKFFLIKEDIGDETVISLPSPMTLSVPVYAEGGLQTYMDVLRLLKTLNPDDPRITRVPPQRPIVAGQVYVYALNPGQSAYDWRFDGFQWVNLRANNFPKKNVKPVLTRHEFRLLDKGNKVDFFRHEYHEPGHNFKYPINIAHWKSPYIVIHYFGNYPVNEAQLAPHAGRRNGGGPLMRSPKKGRSRELVLPLNNPLARAISSAVASIADQDDLDDNDDSLKRKDPDHDDDLDIKRGRTDPMEIYGAVVESEGSGANKVIDLTQLALLTCNGIEVTGPNLKHRNPNANSRKPKSTSSSISGLHLSIAKDDMYGCYVLNEAFSGPNKLIRRLDFTNGSCIVVCESHLLQHINTLAALDLLDSKLAFTYQPVAKLYLFLVTTLFLRHPLFDTTPYVPVAVLLHRQHSTEAHANFFATMKQLIPVLNTSEVDLIIFDEPGVTKAVETQLPDIPTVHVADPNGPRISSSKLDYILVSCAKTLTFDHTKMVHLVYFLQCNIYNEIIRTIAGVGPTVVGDLQVQAKYDDVPENSPSLAARLLPEGGFEILEDAICPSEVVTMLSRNPPQVLGSGSDYQGCSENELQLFEGLAHFFIAKDRIQWLKGQGIFSVKGLGGTEYHVKLAGRTCTCPRSKACEHVLAVLIATGLLARQQ